MTWGHLFRVGFLSIMGQDPGDVTDGGCLSRDLAVKDVVARFVLFGVW